MAGVPNRGSVVVRQAPASYRGPAVQIPISQSRNAPRPPAQGGHYVKVGGNWQLIHAVGRGKWAPGPVPMAGPGVSVNNPLVNPSQPLQGKSLYQAGQALVDAQTAGPLAELAKQIAQNDAHTQGTMRLAGGYFNQLGQQAGQGVTAENQIASALNQQLAGIGQGTQQQLQGIGQNAQNTLSQYAPQGEGGLSNAAQQSLASEIARQQGLAAQQSGASQAFGATQGANYGGLAATGLGVNALRGTEAIKGIGQSGTVLNQPLTQKVADINASKGSLLATDLGKLRQQEINNQITQQGLGIKSADIASQNARTAATINAANARNAATIAGENSRAARSDAARLQIALAQQASQTASLNERTRHDKASEALTAAGQNLRAAAKGGKVRVLTPAQSNTIYRNIDEMAVLIRSAQQAGHKAADIKQALATGQAQKGFPAQSALFIEAAYELLGWGALLPQTAAAMRSAGLRGGTFRGKPIGVRKPPQSIGQTFGLSSTLGQLSSAVRNVNVGG